MFLWVISFIPSLLIVTHTENKTGDVSPRSLSGGSVLCCQPFYIAQVALKAQSIRSIVSWSPAFVAAAAASAVWVVRRPPPMDADKAQKSTHLLPSIHLRRCFSTA